MISKILHWYNYHGYRYIEAFLGGLVRLAFLAILFTCMMLPVFSLAALVKYLGAPS